MMADGDRIGRTPISSDLLHTVGGLLILYASLVYPLE